MADFELFNGTNLEEPDSDHRIAMNKPSLAGAFFVRWDNFKNLIRSFTVSKDTDQSISGNKTFTGIVNVQAPTSDNNPVTLKYFNDNAGGGGGTLTFDTSFELTAYLTNPDREAGQLATCLDLGYEDVILRLSNDTTEWEVIEATVYATQEQAIECIETAVVMNPLRSAQQWVYNVLTRTFEELTTASKTIIGAINELKTNVIKLESDETPAAIADTDNVRFKSATGYYVRTLLAIKNYVKSGLKASEVANDSTCYGATVEAVFNAAEAVEVSDLLSDDLIPAQRYGVGNVMIPYSLFGQTSDGSVFAATAGELTDALAAEKETMQICATEGVTISSISNVYAGNVWITGRKITISSGFSLLNSTSARAVTRLVFDAAINFTGDSGDGTCIIGATAGIWHLTFRDLTSAKPIKIFASAGAEIHITTRRLITVDAGSTGTYSLSSDPTLDVIDDDIIVNTNIAIGATYAGPYVIANVPDKYLVDSIEITDVTLTAFSLIPKFETSTDTYTEIANSQQKVTDKSIYIYNNKPIQTGLGLINNTRALSVYVLNTYGVNRRLVLSDYSGGWTNSTVNVKVVLKENK